MIAPQAFLEQTIRPVLQILDAPKPEAAADLLLGTALQESDLLHRRQLGGGPGRGLFQMEPATHEDIWANFLRFRPQWARRVEGLLSRPGAERLEELEQNDRYAAAMVRVHYLRVPDPLPDAGDLEGLAQYWKQHYNTARGRGTVDQFIARWRTRLPE